MKSRIGPVVVLVVWLVTAMGCGSTSRVPSERSGLEEINREIGGHRQSQLTFSDGRIIRRAHHVNISKERTTFESPYGSREIPTTDLLRVEILAGRDGGGLGFMLGALPGVAIAGFGMLMSGSGPHEGLGNMVGLSVGIPAAVVGGLLGGILGNGIDKDEKRVVYEGPVDRYLR